jgi:hypothetical protein
MNKASGEVWYYTREGEHIGPVNLTELRVKAAEGSLHPRRDMVWTQGMAEWQPAGEVADLFEKRVAADPPPEPLSPQVDPYRPPQHEEAEEMLSQEGGWPGARRRSLYVMTLLFPIAWKLGFVAVSGLIGTQFGPRILQVATVASMFVPWMLAVYFGLQRLANLGMSRWWYLGNFVPLLNLWVSYRMYVCPAGYAYHKKLDGIGVVLAVCYWLMVLLALLAFAVILAVLFGAISNPALQQQVQEAIRTLREQTAMP